VQFDHFGNYLLSGSGKGIKITALVSKIWEDTHAIADLHEGVVNTAKFSPSGRFIVTGGEDRFMKVLSI